MRIIITALTKAETGASRATAAGAPAAVGAGQCAWFSWGNIKSVVSVSARASLFANNILMFERKGNGVLHVVAVVATAIAKTTHESSSGQQR